MNTYRTSLVVLLTLLGLTSLSIGDELLLDHADDHVQLGDYRCSSYRFGASDVFPLLGANSSTDDRVGEVTAGELWRFFNDQGFEKLDKLVLCVDVDQLAIEQNLGLTELELVIEDANSNVVQQSFSIGKNSLIVPASQTYSYRPECKLVVQLDFDFMKRFNAGSNQIVRLNLGLDSSSQELSPAIFIEGKTPLFSLPNLGWMALFCSAWLVFFFFLKWFTIPKTDSVLETIKTPAPVSPSTTPVVAANSAFANNK